ncbi:MAG TPA: HAD hydrolase family protein [Candidatus Binatia bacterium]|nr:HAD hydrolase family protein [Candidatus Binatia bacterium]
MYCRVLACDFDGTTAINGRLAPEVAATLRAARAHGVITLLVTGRVLADLHAADVDWAAFDAVVAENGALVWLPAADRTIHLGTPPPEHFLGELRARGVPFHAGAVVVGTWDRHAGELLDVVRRLGVDGQLVFNREALMLLPSGVNKAAGVRRAIEEFARSEHNLVAFGDAENDLPLLTMAELGVAARGAVPAVAAAADERLSHPGGAGVAHYVDALLAAGAAAPTPPRRRIVLGQDDGGPVTLPGSGTNVMISGDPRSGKSWLAGLVAEQLIDEGYRLCVLDPEGDHLCLGRRPRVLVLGHDLPLPAPPAVPHLLAEKRLSVVLSLAALPQRDKLAYACDVLDAIGPAQTATGVPHWTMVDEAHYFFHEAASSCRHAAGRAGSLLLVTYRPSLVAAEVYASVQAHLITRTAIDEERYFVTALLRSRHPTGLVDGDALRGIGGTRVGLLRSGDTAPCWTIFTPGVRSTAQAHHGRKYADLPVAENKAFRFLHADGTGPTLARSVAEFHAAVRAVPLASLRHHLIAGDFSRWAADVLRDEPLARGLRKLEETARTGGVAHREEILAHLADRYFLPVT